MATPNIVELLRIFDKLKHLKRTGWVHNGVPEPETVACHMYRMAMLAWSLQGTIPVNIDRCVRMALVHDVGEAIVGDITPHCGVSEEDKYTRENEAVAHIQSLAPSTNWKELWDEYEDGKTDEARVVKQLDKFDMIAQADEYESKYGLDLSQFFSSTTKAFSSEPFLTWDRDLRERRERRLTSGGDKQATR